MLSAQPITTHIVLTQPPLLRAKSTKELSSSLQHLYMGVVFSRDAETSFAASGGWIDVRDIALAHVLAVQKPEAGGERIIISAGDFVWQDFRESSLQCVHFTFNSTLTRPCR